VVLKDAAVNNIVVLILNDKNKIKDTKLKIIAKKKLYFFFFVGKINFVHLVETCKFWI